MSAPLIVSARETLEASLLIGIFAAYLCQTDNRRHLPGIWIGIALAAISSALATWTLILAVGGLGGTMEGIFKGAVQLAAAGVLTCVLWQMRQQRSSEVRTVQPEARVALAGSFVMAIAAVPFFAVFHKGTDTFLYLAAVSTPGTAPAVAVGAAVGFGAGATAGYLIYRSLELRIFFKVTTFILLVFAAGMVSQATLDFQAGGIFPDTLPAWDMRQFLQDSRGMGSVLRSLVGYSAMPSLLQVILWLGYVSLTVSLYFGLGSKDRSGNGEGSLSTPVQNYQHALYRFLRWHRLTVLVPTLLGIALVLLLVTALFAINVGPFNNEGMLSWGPFVSAEDENNLFNFAMWIIWLPLLSIGTILFGRIWCGNLCPLRLATDTARGIADMITGKGSPATPYQRLGWLLPISFIGITFVVKMVARATGSPVRCCLLPGHIWVCRRCGLFLS